MGRQRPAKANESRGQASGKPWGLDRRGRWSADQGVRRAEPGPKGTPRAEPRP
jgi:hypothetical protein